MDIFSEERRKEIMRNVKGKNTSPEIAVRKYLFKKGFRYGLHNRNLPGSPDIVLRKYKAVIFVNGCFWHGHKDCSKAKLPKTRVEFWSDKIEKNKVRDDFKAKQLYELGWKVITVYQCDLKKKKLEHTMETIISSIKQIYNCIP